MIPTKSRILLASSSSTRTVADQACVFGSRQSRGGENRRGVI